MHLTVKQIELLTVIAAGSGPNPAKPKEVLHCDLDQILDRVRYETTKQSLQFSIRALIGRGLIEKKGVEKRRGRQRQVIAATEDGRDIVGTPAPAVPPAPAYVSSVEADASLSAIEILE